MVMTLTYVLPLQLLLSLSTQRATFAQLEAQSAPTACLRASSAAFAMPGTGSRWQPVWSVLQEAQAVNVEPEYTTAGGG